MLAAHGVRGQRAAGSSRRGTAAAECACCLPLLVMVLTGAWQVGRIAEVQQVMWNSTREGARDASLGQDSLSAVASRLLVYLQGAEPTAFGTGHTTTMKSPVIALAANTYGYTCWDNTANRELFTVTFTDLTTPTVTDPTGMSQLDLFTVTVSAPYAGLALTSLTPVAGITRLSASVTWAALVDSPFEITPYLPAQ
jgi:Flp pilus assembly protein TadG